MDNQDKGMENKPYIKEKIVKKKKSPMKIIGKVFLCLLLGIVFGASAAFTFYYLGPKLEKETASETTQASVILPQFSQEATTEAETEADESSTEEESVAAGESGDQSETGSEEAENTEALAKIDEKWIENKVQNILNRQNLGIDDVKQTDALLAGVAKEVSKGLVTVRGYENKKLKYTFQALVIYRMDENREILLLANQSDIAEADRLTAEFSTVKGREFEITRKGHDSIYNLEILAVSSADFTEKELNGITVISLGNNFNLDVCHTVLFIGKPYLNEGSVAAGRIVKIDADSVALDSTYRLFTTDAILPEGASAYVISLSGQLVGILIPAYANKSLNSTAFVGTNDIRNTLNCMCNGRTAGKLGVYAQTVTEELQNEGIPKGVYVIEVEPDGPAYNAGICAGDIITGMSQAEIGDVSKMSDELTGNHLPGETIIVSIYREGPGGYKQMELSVQLGSR